MTEKKKNLTEKLLTLPGIAKATEFVKSAGQGTAFISPLYGSAKALLIKSLFENYSVNPVVLLPDLKSINELNVELNLLGLEDKIDTLESTATEEIQQTVSKLLKTKNFVLIAPYELLEARLPSKNSLSKKTTTLNLGDEIDFETLTGYFAELEYDRDRYVDEPGQYAIRGAVVDFWSYSEKLPCRIEFDGDFIESMRYFDPDTQRSYKTIESVTLAEKISGEDEELNSNIFDYLSNFVVLAEEAELIDFLDSEEKKEIEEDDLPDKELAEELLLTKQEETTDEATNTARFFNSFDDLKKTNFPWLIEDTLKIHTERFDTGLRPAPEINSNFKILASVLENHAQKNFEILITAENDIQEQRLSDLLQEYNESVAGLILNGKVKVKTLPIKEGFVDSAGKTLVLTDYSIFNKPYRQKLFSGRRTTKKELKELSSIKPGDFVVHENYGIGKYVGLVTIKIGEINQESIKILYADGGAVYVNLNYLGLVKKFSSKDSTPPRLTALGSGEWKRTKKKVKSKIKDAARELIKLYAQRKASKGFKFSPDTVWQKELEAAFFYEPTYDQLKVTEEVKNDMESEQPMDRLICGDVGFGKTEIAVRAAFKAVNDGKQVCLLVPTTILAEQHYNTFVDRLGQYPVRIEALSRFQTKKKQTEIIEGLKKGLVDIVIGTHRLLSKDVEFKDLGLLIIDEEHRFGVMAKEKLKKIKVNVDTLALTATPIPRTLNMSLLGARDLSIIATPPPNRQPIYTRVEKFDVKKMREWILQELNRNGQVYIVHDRVQSIDKLASYIQKYMPEANIAVAHGKMKPLQLEKVIHDFLNKKHNVLITTKIIESGIDIPSVNTIIINRADRFGLAELHQLRGRVGRSDKQAYAYLVVPSLNAITKKAVKRLQAIEEYSQLGEGFNISMRDLEIRGAGNLLGTEQSGVIDSVGFDLYVKLLDEAVSELKREEFSDVFKSLPMPEERSRPKIEAYFELGIPKDFMPDQSDRLYYYSNLFSALNEESIDETIEEISDKFGKFPLELERLFLAARLRLWASIILFEKISITKEKVVFFLPDGENEDFYKNKFSYLMKFIFEKHPDFKFKQGKTKMSLEAKNFYPSPESSLQFAIRFCKEVNALFEK